MPKLFSEWKFTRLRNAAKRGKSAFIDGDWIEAPYITNSGIRLIQTGNVGRGHLIEKSSSQRYISKQTFLELNCSWVRSGDILICRLAGPIGRACSVPDRLDKSVTSVDVTIMRVNEEEFYPHFVLHYLNSERNLERAADVAGGSTRSRISRTNLGSLEIPSPPILQQQKIAQILDTLDTQIQKTEALIAKLEKIKEGLLHDLLTRGIDQNGQLRPTPDQAPELYKESVLGLIPSEWEVANVRQDFVTDSGFTLGVHRRPKRNARPYLRVANVHRGRLDLSEIAYLEAQDDEMAKKSLSEGDLLIVEGHANPNEIGRCAMATEAVSGYTFQNHLFRLRATTLHPHFAFLWMNSHTVKQYWRKAASSSSGLYTINRTKLDAVPTAKPRRAEQLDISNLVRRHENEIAVTIQELQKLKSFKAGLAGDLLTGRVRVTPLLKDAV